MKNLIKSIFAILIASSFVSCGVWKHKLKSVYNNDDLKITMNESGYYELMEYSIGDTITITQYKRENSFLSQRIALVGEYNLHDLNLRDEKITHVTISKFILEEKNSLN